MNENVLGAKQRQNSLGLQGAYIVRWNTPATQIRKGKIIQSNNNVGCGGKRSSVYLGYGTIATQSSQHRSIMCVCPWGHKLLLNVQALVDNTLGPSPLFEFGMSRNK